MEMLARLNEALAYVEEKLTETVDYKEAARIACCSEYHFTRMFSFLAGISLSEYIRRRRLTLAAQELSGGDCKVIDVALRYGYASPDSFARAFQSMHGVTPSEARLSGQSLKAFPRMTFQLTIQGGREMNYRLEEKDAFRIVGIHKRVPIQFHGVNPEIAKMYESLTPERIATLKGLSNMQPAGIISASVNFGEGRMEEQGELDHYVGVATTKEAPAGLAQLEVAASQWAVFTAVGPFPSALQEVWGRIYSEWFPSSEYELSPGPELLWNEHPDVTSPQYRSELWIPVTKRQRS
ncbi:putative HTH-type transcriptional regulator YdeE [Paenibacillus sp. J31TS4]|uniref:AraC family transcriptional regulator n=1 Tax=Paenibacillus sp. J31TS4 TaxID=2807195 RepID=UPI001B1377E7|nr:AraC family transcriptional regulator [Paenibacillus sp. J31TS4]GIP40561.1 putative HTH-type transcriptional regulator YdeE [Paenibacillus sp. J31TS4]